MAGTKPEDPEQSFYLATKRNLTIDEYTPLWTRPPVDITENEFLGASMEDLARWIARVTSDSVAPIWWRHRSFVVLDKRSMEDNTAVLVNVFQNWKTRTVRCLCSTVVNAACNHSEGLEPDIHTMQECQDERGVDRIYTSKSGTLLTFDTTPEGTTVVTEQLRMGPS